MANFIFEVKSNKNATEGRKWSGKVNGIDKTVNDIRYEVSVPTFQTLNAFCEECKELSEAAQLAVVGLINTAIANSYMNKAVECIAREVPVEEWNLEAFFTMTGNREGLGKAISMAEEKIISLTTDKMLALAGLNGILNDVISGKLSMADAPKRQKELEEEIDGIDGQIAFQNERLAELQVMKAAQDEKNKARGLLAAAARKAKKKE